MDDTKRMYLRIGEVLVATGAVCGLFIHGHKMEAATANQYHTAVMRNQSAHNKDIKKHHEIRDELFGNAIKSRDPIIKTIAINSDDNKTIHKPFLHFFNVFYNWKNHNDYVARPKKLQNIATKNVLKNKQLFGNDKTGNGGSVINHKQLNSEFNNLNTLIMSHKGTNIDVLADVQYNSWQTSTDNQNTRESWYEMNYDTKTHKITSIKDLYSVGNVKNDNN